jgi:hypothetical protein
MKCNYCENEATIKDYREQDGITGKVFVCVECFNLNNEGCKNREHEMATQFKEIFSLDVDSVIESAWGEFWDTVNMEMDGLGDSLASMFKDETGILPHNDTIDNWKELFVEEIGKELKKNV